MSCTSCQGNKLKKVTNIIQGNYNLITNNEEANKIAAPRIKICEGCEFKRKLIKVNQVQRYYCTICTCPVDSKARAIEESCPKGKW